MAVISREEFLRKTWIPPVSKFALYSSLLKGVARFQMGVDRRFSDKWWSLRRKVLDKKITATAFWLEYKKILIDSASRDKKIVKHLIGKIDREMTQLCKETEKAEKKRAKEKEEEKPPLDLSLPE